jgi:hypothetical protein
MGSSESIDLGRIGHGAKNAQIDSSHFSDRVYHFHPWQHKGLCLWVGQTVRVVQTERQRLLLLSRSALGLCRSLLPIV